MSSSAIGGNIGGTPEASYDDVYNFLDAMEELDPEGTLVAPVRVPNI